MAQCRDFTRRSLTSERQTWLRSVAKSVHAFPILGPADLEGPSTAEHAAPVSIGNALSRKRALPTQSRSRNRVSAPGIVGLTWCEADAAPASARRPSRHFIASVMASRPLQFATLVSYRRHPGRFRKLPRTRT